MIHAIQKEVNQSNLNGLRCAVITCDENYDQYLDTLRISLGSIKKPDELASNLFESLRECDKNNVDIIFAEAFDESDIGLALMNRLKKAAGFKIITV
jgi:L-threonylcarbamoyladenylate synthase